MAVKWNKRAAVFALVFLIWPTLCRAEGSGESSTSYDISNEPVEFQSLALAIEKNMQVRRYIDTYGNRYRAIEATVVIVPLNRDVIAAAVDYKRVSERLTASQAGDLLERNVSRFLEGNTATFAIMVDVKPTQPSTLNYDPSRSSSRLMDSDDYVRFIDFEANTTLREENGTNHSLIGYTRLFDEVLSPGWNNGYLHFRNFRDSSPTSYSLHFRSLVVDTMYSNLDHPSVRGSWAFAFDETEVQYLALLKKGVASETIRQNYGINEAAKTDISILDVLNAFSAILTIVGFFA